MLGFSVNRMVRGNDYGPRIDVEQCQRGASSPRLDHVVTFTTPRQHVFILPCMLCNMVPVSPAGIRGRRPKRLDTYTIQTLERVLGRYSILVPIWAVLGHHDSV